MPDKSSNPFRPSPQYPPQEYHHQPSPFLPPPQSQGMDPRAIPTGSAYSDRPPSYERAAHGRNPNYGEWQSGPVDYHREGVSPQMSYPPSYPPAQGNGFPSQQGYDPSPHQPGPQAAHDWTGQPPPEQSPGFSLSSITKIFSGSSSNPLDPPPPCFSRPPPHNVSYEPFQTMGSYGLGKEIRDGFTQLPPPSMLQPHPFASHDIQEDDWHRFLSDVKKAGELSTRENITAAVLPLTMNIGLTGMLVSKAIKNGQSRRKQDPTSKLVDVWNHYFFRPRRMEVILAKGDMRLSGHMEAGVLPDAHRGHTSSEDSPSSSDEETRGQGRRSDRRPRMRERRQRRRSERGEERGTRRSKRKEQRTNKTEVYRLIIVPA